MSNENGRLLLANLLSDYPGEMRTWGETPDEEAISEARSLLADADAQCDRADAAERECARLRALSDGLRDDAARLRADLARMRHTATRLDSEAMDLRQDLFLALDDRNAARAEATGLRASLDEASRSIRELVRNTPRD